jgi:hypothetical protein
VGDREARSVSDTMNESADKDVLSRVGEALLSAGFVTGTRLLGTGHLAIATILTYPDGGTIEVFLIGDDLVEDSDSFRLTDFGNTASWLSNLGIEIWADDLYRELVDLTLRDTPVFREADALQTAPTKGEELASGVIALAQMCLRVADLAYVHRAGSSEHGPTFARPIPRRPFDHRPISPAKRG